MGLSALALALDHPTKAAIARVLGYTSIGCWLCAQLPQVVKNASLRSCEGLALPFLCNWLFGDLTNLIGCLLTDQLPFQTYLAMYFCMIDLALVGQYIHYTKPRSAPATSSATHTPRYISYSTLVQSPQQSLILPPASAPPSRTRSSSGPSHHLPHSATTRPRTKRGLSYLPPDINVTPAADGSYQAIYEAALDVARAAERASHRRSRSKRRRLSRQASAASATASASGGLAEINDEGMVESFHSDMSGHTASTVAGGSPKGDRARLTQSTGTLLDMRGRSMARTRTRSHGGTGTDTVPSPVLDELDLIDGLPKGNGLGLHLDAVTGDKRSQSRSVSLARGSGGRGGRRAAGVAFMSMGLLVGWGSWSGPSTRDRSLSAPTGMVIATSEPVRPWSAIRHPSFFPILEPVFSPNVTILYMPPRGEDDGPPTAPHPPHPPDTPPSFQRIVGRVSSWACTTLYLTSRLPQIWMNFQRKSVEGLSILLFLFAFLGNISYVASILLNPTGDADPSEAGHYLLEALPYLLGSGGTLMFDLTIMIQSLVYGSAPPVHLPPTPLERSRRRGYFTQKRKLRHLEDGSHAHAHAHGHGHSQAHGHGHGHAHARTYSSNMVASSSAQSGERQPLLPPMTGLGISLSRSVSPEENRRRRESSSRRRNGNASTTGSEGEGLSQSPIRSLSRS
ncbi:hypothetical protein IAU60_002168 [Kwoniella sp. DSM 27419]